MAERVLQLILRRSALVLLLIVAATIPEVWTLTSAKFSASIVESFVDNHQEFLDAMELEDRYPGNPDALVWLATDEGDQLFTPHTLSAIRRAANEIEKLSGVLRVTALPNLDRPPRRQYGLRGVTQRVVVNAKLKRGEIPETPPEREAIWPGQSSGAPDVEELQALKTQILASDGYAGRFLSRDGRCHAMVVELKSPSDMAPLKQVALVQELLDVVRQQGLGRAGVYCSGLIPLQAFAYEQIELVLKMLFPAGCLLIAVAVVVVFRRMEVIAITLLIAGISVVWGVALGAFAFGDLSVLMAAVPLMVLVISTADVIHLISSYSAERDRGLAHDVALKKMFCEVGRACVLTSITTFVGFASLALVPSKTIRQFGFSTAAGVASALLLSVLLVPIFLQWLHGRGRSIETSSTSYLTGMVARGCLAVGVRWYGYVMIAFAVLLGTSATMASRLRLDPDLTRRFTATHPITQSTLFFQREFGGINSVEILLRGPPETLLSRDNLSDILAFSEDCLSNTEATGVDSIAAVLSQVLHQLDYNNSDGLPQSVDHARATIRYMRRVNSELFDSLITPEMDELRILVRVDATSYMDQLDRSSAIFRRAREQFAGNVIVLEKGSAPLVGRAIREIIRGHYQGFFFCFTTIMVLIVVGLRSFKLGWLSVLPNLTPLLLLGGLVALWTRVVDSDILAVATLGLGLAVDDTIHFLSRFKIEFRSGCDLHAALRRTMDHTGLAIIRTTLILSVGFLPLAFSGYWSIRMLGTYLVGVLFAALLADLILLPAIVVLAYRKTPAG